MAAAWPPGAYKDGCRVAAADAGLWTAIFRDNRGPLLKALGTLQERLDAFKYALMTDDEAAISRWYGVMPRNVAISLMPRMFLPNWFRNPALDRSEPNVISKSK